MTAEITRDSLLFLSVRFLDLLAEGGTAGLVSERAAIRFNQRLVAPGGADWPGTTAKRLIVLDTVTSQAGGFAVADDGRGEVAFRLRVRDGKVAEADLLAPGEAAPGDWSEFEETLPWEQRIARDAMLAVVGRDLGGAGDGSEWLFSLVDGERGLVFGSTVREDGPPAASFELFKVANGQVVARHTLSLPAPDGSTAAAP